MKLLKTKNYKEMSEKSVEIVIKEINKKPNLAVAFATGKTSLGLYKSLVEACKKKKIDFSENKLKKNGIDLMILGVGINGHIAFNEPGSLKESKTRLVELFSETIKKNK